MVRDRLHNSKGALEDRDWLVVSVMDEVFISRHRFKSTGFYMSQLL